MQYKKATGSDILECAAYETSTSLLSALRVHSFIHILPVLLSLSTSDKKTYLEIGVYKGGSLDTVKNCADYFVGVDLFDYPFPDDVDQCPKQSRHTVLGALENTGADTSKITLIEGDSTSQEVIDSVAKSLGRKKADLLFIDGAHTEDYLYRDLVNYIPFVKRGGFIACDDVGFPGYANLIAQVDQFKERYQVNDIGCLPNKAGASFHGHDKINPIYIMQKL